MRKIINSVKKFLASPKTRAVAVMLLVGGTAAFAQSAAGDYTAGTSALTTVAEEIAKYVPIVVKLCYAIAGVVAIIGAISVYIAMNNDEQDVASVLRTLTGKRDRWMESAGKDTRYPDYPLFRGLQRPLEFMGLQGRYIYWAAGAVGGAIIGFIIAYIIGGFVAGLVTLVAFVVTGAALVMFKQRRGLHSKKVDRGVFVYASSKRL